LGGVELEAHRHTPDLIEAITRDDAQVVAGTRIGNTLPFDAK
jgi:hypothetical protein